MDSWYRSLERTLCPQRGVSALPCAAEAPIRRTERVTIQDLGSAGEFVTAIATLITLVYLALQLRNNASVSRFDAHLKVRQLAAEAGAILSDPVNARLWRIGLSDPDALSEDERIGFSYMLVLVVNSIDARLEYERATGDPKAYKTQGNIMDTLASQPGFQRWWESWAHAYNAEMNAFVERSMRENGASMRPFF